LLKRSRSFGENVGKIGSGMSVRLEKLEKVSSEMIKVVPIVVLQVIAV
jgi:hypothetical protein